MRMNLWKRMTLLGIVFFFLFSAFAISARAEAQPQSLGDLDAQALFKAAMTAEVPIVMYHLVTKNGQYIGRYGITPTELENDLKYLSEQQYETVVMDDLIDFVYRARPLPSKCVVLTFDDGNYSDYAYLFPLLRQYNMRAVLSIMGKQSDECTAEAEKNPAGRYPNLTWPQTREMVKEKLVEIQSHGYNVHGPGGSGKRSGESTDAYVQRFKGDLEKLQQRCRDEIRREPTTFTFPLGVMSEPSHDALKEMGFKASLSCTEGLNVLKLGEADCLFKLKRTIRPSGRGIEHVLAQMPAQKK